MAPLPSVSDLTVEEYFFPATVTPPESEKTLFLAGAGNHTVSDCKMLVGGWGDVGFAGIAFSKDTSVPEKGVAVIENKALTLSFLESVIGKHGVSPAAKRSIAERISGLLK
ncbi:Chalcone--flavonone isomerase [Nymphaea thermarum]|nr:Chalcone--flavonone isomerase [Nymphaea thermarum]